MTRSDETVQVRVTHRFDASAERVYDAFLDPAKAGKFMFITGTGQNVRCEIDPRVGGTFTIVDRRDGEDVAHKGQYLELERPRRIVFTLTVPKYSQDSDEVTIEIAPRAWGCDLTLTHEMKASYAPFKDRTQEGWKGILEAASQIVVDAPPTCGIGVAQHAPIPARIARLFEGLAETLSLHRQMLKLDDPNARKEDEVYRDLAARWKDLAERVAAAAAQMAAQRELPMGAHDESAWSDPHLRAFEKFVQSQSQLLALLRLASERDEKTLAEMTKEG
jgi:uncharacterized protein YndB with AHSA1/START domain